MLAHKNAHKSKLSNYIHVNPRIETVTCGIYIMYTEPVNHTSKFSSKKTLLTFY